MTESDQIYTNHGQINCSKRAGLRLGPNGQNFNRRFAPLRLFLLNFRHHLKFFYSSFDSSKTFDVNCSVSQHISHHENLEWEQSTGETWQTLPALVQVNVNINMEQCCCCCSGYKPGCTNNCSQPVQSSKNSSSGSPAGPAAAHENTTWQLHCKCDK